MKYIANAKSATTVLLAILVATIVANFGNLMQSASGSGGGLQSSTIKHRKLGININNEING